MYSHSYEMALIRERQREVADAAERRNRTSPTRSSRGLRRRPGGARA